MSSMQEDSIYLNGDISPNQILGNGDSHHPHDQHEESFLFASESVGEGHPGNVFFFDSIQFEIFSFFEFSR